MTYEPGGPSEKVLVKGILYTDQFDQVGGTPGPALLNLGVNTPLSCEIKVGGGGPSPPYRRSHK